MKSDREPAFSSNIWPDTDFDIWTDTKYKEGRAILYKFTYTYTYNLYFFKKLRWWCHSVECHIPNLPLLMAWVVGMVKLSSSNGSKWFCIVSNKENSLKCVERSLLSCFFYFLRTYRWLPYLFFFFLRCPTSRMTSHVLLRACAPWHFAIRTGFDASTLPCRSLRPRGK